MKLHQHLFYFFFALENMAFPKFPQVFLVPSNYESLSRES